MRRDSRNVAIILLAGGQSARFGTPKQLLLYKGRSLLRYLAEIAVSSQASSVHIVLGAYAELLKMQLLGLHVDITQNSRWNEGISTSIRAGISSLKPSAGAALLLLCDQPLVTTQLLNRIIETYVLKRQAIVASEYGNSLGIPALFDRSLFTDLMKLSGDRGAKQIIMKHRSKTAAIPFPQGIVDIDSVEDEVNFRKEFKS